MEVSVIGSSQVKLGRNELGCRDVGSCSFSKSLDLNISPFPKNSKLFLGQSIKWPLKSSLGFTIRASACASAEAVISENLSEKRRSKATEDLKLYVGLPLDTVSESNTINHARAIAAGLKALKLLGVDGVELPIWWGIAEKEAMGKYDWTGYLAIIEMIQKIGLEVHVSLCFHASKELKIPLPTWVSQVGESEPSIYFTDRSGQQYKECLSLAVDDLPVLGGKSAIEVYKDFLENFKASFSTFLGSTITGVSVGLGPDGELRYPSNDHSPTNKSLQGAGEFQCYDKNMLNHLKQHAEALGNPLWGLSGPHDAPKYDQPPSSSNFFKEHGGSWESPYADFFLSWYSKQLVCHGDRLLSVASSTFKDVPITISGKIPLVHSWYQSRSHPAELTAGFYNTATRDGYKAVMEMFSRNSCSIVLPGMDLSDDHQSHGPLSSPEQLLAQITTSCRNHGVEILGQNSLVSGPPSGFEQIKNNLGETPVVSLFTYQRMGAYFFSPEHFPSFTAFVRNLDQPEAHPDDRPLTIQSTESIHMQAA